MYYGQIQESAFYDLCLVRFRDVAGGNLISEIKTYKYFL